MRRVVWRTVAAVLVAIGLTAVSSGAASAAPAAVVWTASVNKGYVLGNDVGAGNVAHVWFDNAGKKYRLSVRNAADGALRWTKALPAAAYSSPKVLGPLDLVLVSVAPRNDRAGGRLIGFRLSTGARVGVFTAAPGDWFGSIESAGGLVVTEAGGILIGLTPQLKKVWTWADGVDTYTGNWVPGGDGSLYVAQETIEDTCLVKVRVADGAELAEVCSEYGDYVELVPDAAAGVVLRSTFLDSVGYGVTAHRMSDLSVVWERPELLLRGAAEATTDGTAAVIEWKGGPVSTIHRLDTTTGATVCRGPALAEKLVPIDVDRADGALYAANELDGTQVLRFDGCALTWRYADAAGKNLKDATPEGGRVYLTAGKTVTAVR